MRKIVTFGVSVLALTLISNLSVADEMVYGDFPVTVQGYSGSKTTSVSYTGQIARHTLHDSLKKMAGHAIVQRDYEQKKHREKMMSNFEG